MDQYLQFRYYYPPRPQIKSPTSGLDTYERMGFIGQPKLNGSCALSFTDGSNIKLMNRHNNTFARELISKDDLLRLHRGSGYQCLCGEYMNKSKKDSKGQLFNGCIVLFDIMIHNGQYLTGTTFLERQILMDRLFPGKDYDDYLYEVSNNVYRVKNFTKNFKSVFNEMVKIDMYEGCVLKRPNGILEPGYRPENNTGWQLKIRKPEKNYSY